MGYYCDDKVYDVAIIGSGSVGSFAGYYASKQGLKTCLIDNFLPPHTNGSYHGDTRIFRIAYGEGEKYIPLLQRAFDLWVDFEEESKQKLFERCGVLNIGNPFSEFMRNVAQSSEDFNLDAILLRPKDIKNRYEIDVPSDFFGILETQTGFIYSEKSVESAIRLACSKGADLFISQIRQIEYWKNYYIISTDSNEIRAKKILISAGSFADEILRAFEARVPRNIIYDDHLAVVPRIPVRPKRKVLNWFNSNSYKLCNGMPAFIMEFGNDHFYGFPDFGSGVKIGLNAFGQYISSRNQLGNFGDIDSDTTAINDHIRSFMPHLGNLSRGAVCTYAMTPDEGFIFDFIINQPFSYNPPRNFILYIGGLSHGFKFAPALATLGIEALKSGEIPDILKPFSLKRFNGKV